MTTVREPQQPDFQIFVRVAALLNSFLELDAVLRELLGGLDDLLQPTHWSLLLRDDRTGELIFTLGRGAAYPRLVDRRLAPTEGIAGWVAEHDEAVLIRDVADDPRFSRRMDELSGFRTRSLVAVPLRTRGRCIGVLEIVNASEERPFNETDLAILGSYADFAAIAIHNARTHAAIVEASRQDALTGLANSAHFIRCIEDAIGRGGSFAVVFFDMDHFKALVDTHGHVRGSAALAEVGQVIRAHLTAGEIGCRFGGDEFAILFPEMDGAGAAERCGALERLITTRTFLDDEGISARLGASFGAAAFPQDGRTATDLLRVADARMYESKRARGQARET